MRRRDFLMTSACCVAAASPLIRGTALAEGAPPGAPARHSENLTSTRVRCNLCPRRCELDPGERGYCGTRRNSGGSLRSLVYARPCTVRSDPIEKKPLFHYLPGTDAFSIATAGCNLGCQFCQNWRISQYRPEEVESFDLPPAAVAARAQTEGARSVAFTYSEPIVFYEYMYDCAVAARAQGLGRVMISNGSINQPPLEALLDVLDGVKVDLKSFRDSFYRDLCDGELRPVLETLRTIRRRSVWLEIVVLVIPTRNDSDAEMRALSRWIGQELGPDVPLHLTRFHPTYQLTNLPPTPVSTIERLREVALSSGLHYVYLGNVPGHEAEGTSCHRCGNSLIERDGFHVRVNRIQAGRCPRCSTPIPGHWG